MNCEWLKWQCLMNSSKLLNGHTLIVIHCRKQFNAYSGVPAIPLRSTQR
jgi:hypothetical protein